MNLPLGVALTHFIAETGFPTIAHHHDFIGSVIGLVFPQ